MKRQAIIEESEKLLRATCDFQDKSIAARELCRESYRRQESEGENVLRIMIDGHLAILANQLTKKIKVSDTKTSYQIGLVTSFIRTHFVVNSLILDGDLVESLTLIRKQLEIVVRLNEIDSKPLQKLIGRVPNIQNMMKRSAGEVYGILSEVAHFSTPRVSEWLHVVNNKDMIGPSLIPAYSVKSFACFDLNCFSALYFMFWLIQKLDDWFVEYDKSIDIELFERTLGLAHELGVVRLPEDGSDSCF